MCYTDIVRYNAQLYVDVAGGWTTRLFSSTAAGQPRTARDRTFSLGPARGCSICSRRSARSSGDEYLLMTHNDPTFMIPFGNAEEFCVQLPAGPRRMHGPGPQPGGRELQGGLPTRRWPPAPTVLSCAATIAPTTGRSSAPRYSSEFIAPYLKESVAAFKNAGAYVIKHTDGNIMPVLGGLSPPPPTRCTPSIPWRAWTSGR